MQERLNTFNGNDWHWHFFGHADETILHPWSEHPENCKIVKSNAIRQVFTASDAQGRLFHIKYSFPTNLTSYFFHHLRHEFEIAKILHAYGIACPIHYAYGRNGRQELLITETLQNTTWALDFMYSECAENIELCKKFCDAISCAIHNLWSQGFYHRDCHLGNLMYDQFANKIYFIDLSAISKRKFYHSEFSAARQIMSKMLSVSRLLGKHGLDIKDFIISCGLAENTSQAAILWQACLDYDQKQYKKRYAKRIAKILKGEYFLSTIIEYQGHKTYVRTNPQGIPLPFDTGATANLKKMPHDQAEQYWPNAILNREIPMDQRPVAWIVGDNNIDTIVF